MSRQRFGLWGVELSDDDFACALVARGLLEAGLAGPAPRPLTIDGRRMPWRLPDPLDPPPGRRSAATLAGLWRPSSRGRDAGDPIRLAIDPNEPSVALLDPVWLNDCLTRPATKVDGICWERLDSEVSFAPRSAHRVGFLADAASRVLREQIRASASPGFVIVDATETRATCDLLLVPHGLRRTLGEILTYTRLAPIGAIVVLEYTEPTKDSFTLADMLLQQTPAAAVALVSVSALAPARLRAWLAHVLGHIEAGRPLDVALLSAARDQRLPTPFVISRPESLDVSARPSPRWRGRSSARVFTFNDAERLPDVLDGQPAEHLVIEEPAPRMLQARIYDCSQSRPGKYVERALQTHRPHRIDVRIARSDPAWIVANKGFPEEKLGPGPHVLTVVLTEPRLCPAPQVARLVLDGDDRSKPEPCSFFLHTGKVPGELDARITVLHRNRILQTARLHALIVDAASEEDITQSVPNSLTIEAVVRPSLDGLSSRKPFGATLLFNHDGQGTPRVTKFVEERASLVRLGEIGDVVKRIGQRLAQIALDPDDFNGLEAKSTVDLLRALAHDGALLYAGIFVDGGVDPAMTGAKRLQVISAHADAIIPIEFCYDKPAPALDAPLCPGAQDALRSGQCGAACPADPSTVVCPLGFWSLSKVIERHAHDPAYAKQLQWSDYAFQAEPIDGRDRIAPLTAAVGAAADRASLASPKLVEQVFAALQALTAGHDQRVSTWADWKSAIAKESPSLLVLLAHTETLDNKITVLEIGDDERLAQANVSREHVRGQAGSPPIVLLMGCKTAQEDTSFLNFIMPFRQKGAAIVVATLSNVLGRHAAPTTEALLHAMADVPPDGAATLGDVLLRVRRSLVAAGLPMALTLVAFGDADWRIETRPFRGDP